MKANASKLKAMSYGRMTKAEPELAAEIAGWLAAAEAADAAEDAAFGADKRGDELPDWVADKQKRLAKIREAKAALEAQAQAEDKAKRPKRRRGGRKPKPPRRSVLFAFVGAEEQGLLGSKYYAMHPTFPAGRSRPGIPASCTANAIGRAPRIGRNDPSRPSSPARA